MADKRYTDPEIREHASPLCYAHELSPGYGRQSEPGGVLERKCCAGARRNGSG